MERLINMASFAEVVDAGGFSAAAQKLDCSRAVISKRVSALERDFGVSLLHRTTRRQSLTEAGAALYLYCRRLLDEMNSAEAHVHELASTPRGTLRISAPHSYGNRVLGPLLARFLLKFPQIRVELTLSDRLADLAGSAIDIAVRLTNKPAPGLVARHLAKLPYVICAAPNYLAQHGTPHSAQELAHHNCIFYVDDIIQNPWSITTPSGEALEISVQGSLVVNSVEVLRASALEGLGIIAAFQYVVDAELQHGELVQILPDHHITPRHIYLVTLPERLLPAKTRAFIDFLLPAPAAAKKRPTKPEKQAL